ncbi:MAG: sulfite exporter TauE/SafE family protein [Myxococcales bacterium]|nr:sulfite exporter TauE/SafE family protein [Myxococcales bacterium]MDH3484448.1 sulfite exporter TauE/SafE family protein [Myxococcales bacterium]
MLELITLITLVVACFATATISAILGMAGGVTLLGVMTALLPPRVVVPIHGVVQLASNWTRTWAFRRYVRWSIFFTFMVPAVLGVAIGSLLWSEAKLTWFRAWIGAFILFFLLWRRYKPTLRNPPIWSYGVLGLAAGLLTIFVGATGPFLAPFFLRDDFDNEQVIATKAACQTWLHLLKIPAFLALGFDYVPYAPLLLALIAAVIGGTYFGKHLLSMISKERFVLWFQVVLAILAVYLIISAVLD